MKKYEYKVIYLDKNFSEKELNEFGKEGWKVVFIHFSEGGNLLTAILERELSQAIDKGRENK